MRLKGKVAIVSGASRGIGLGIVERFAAEGAIVIAGSRSNPEGIYPEGVEGVVLDVASEADWARATQNALTRHGKIDVLVNNAGIIAYEALGELDMASWQKVVAVNQSGVFLGM